MKYVQPFGAIEGAPYVNANPALGQRGSVVPAEALEHPQREILNVIEGAGLTPDPVNLAQLFAAIQSLIQAATGGGDTSDFVTMTLALSRLPFYPEILTSDGRMNITSPGAGSVLVPEGVSFVLRGIKLFTTSDLDIAQRTLATAANKIYHLRRRPAPINFVLLDVSDPSYNPGGLAENSPAFDSSFDDILVARVVTNSANVAAITPLANKPRLDHYAQDSAGTPVATGNQGYSYSRTDQINWARSPRSPAAWGGIGANQVTAGSLEGGAGVTQIVSFDRYHIAANTIVDWTSNFSGSGIAARLGISASA